MTFQESSLKTGTPQTKSATTATKVCRQVYESACRLCSSADYTLIARELRDDQLYTVVRCRQCSLLYVRETYAAVSPMYIALTPDHIDSDHVWCQTAHKQRAFAWLLELPELQSVERRSLLDVGCGVGGFLDEASSRFVTYGFDASAAQVRAAVKNHPRVRRATDIVAYRRQNPELPGRFDLITLWDVLEHIREPLAFLTELASSLSDDGFLFAAVPAALPMILKSRVLARRASAFSWTPHEHVSYFSPATLARLCAGAELRPVRIGSVPLYPRRLSAFEVVRRAVFLATRYLPAFSPQIYALCRRDHQP